MQIGVRFEQRSVGSVRARFWFLEVFRFFDLHAIRSVLLFGLGRQEMGPTEKHLGFFSFLQR